MSSPNLLFLKNRITDEHYKLDNTGAIISEKTAKMLDAGVGDTVSIKDDVKGELQVKIAQICENYIGHYIYLTPDLYKQLYGESSGV